MTSRNGSYEPGMEEFAESDAFIDALSLGDDPSGGTDPLAAALLELKADIDRPMPEAPQLDALDPAPEAGRSVTSLDSARARRKRQVSPWLAGLIGAAAATVVCVGTGSVLFDRGAQEDTTMVELATTLDELEVASKSGDEEATRQLLEQARGLVATMKEREQRPGKGGQAATVTKTVTDTTTAAHPGVAGDKATAEQAPAAPAAPAQQQTQVPQDPAQQRGAGASQPGQAGQATGQPNQGAQSAANQSGQDSATGAPSQGTAAATEPTVATGAERQNPSVRVNDPATMVQPPAQQEMERQQAAVGGVTVPAPAQGAGSS